MQVQSKLDAVPKERGKTNAVWEIYDPVIITFPVLGLSEYLLRIHTALSLTEKSARDSGCETEHQGRWPFWKSVLWHQENGNISQSDHLREKTVINWKSLEVCNVGNNSQERKVSVHNHKKAADRYGLYIKDFCNIYLAVIQYSVGVCVFPYKQIQYKLIVYMYRISISSYLSPVYTHT